ncbi:facilitated trehalose transporter Tret1-like [Diachasmimorpha longicaudata]|uniref:facilitated trehalose transporter Tret1-like n=1 Tax=Diachasmimorpha longicaudata TaxID=58733 RepID=UPI0030B87F92
MSKNPSDSSGVWRQYVAASIINIAGISTGMSIGWTSPIIPQLEAANTPVGTEPMTKDQISWLTSIFCIAALIISPLCSSFSEKFGRKRLGCLIAIPLGLSWLLTILAPDFTCLLVARILTGVGGGMTIFLVPIYVAEIASDDVRGRLGSFLLFALSIGILLSFILGVVMTYQMFAICGIILPIVFISAFVFMPETPVWLLRKCRYEEATRSLMWLRNNDKGTVDRELDRLKKIIEEDSKSARSVGFRDLVRDRGTIKGSLIAFALLPGQQACGNSVVFTYSATIFQLAGSSLSPNSSAIALGVMQLIASFLSTATIERVGRRFLLLISCGGMAICHGLLGLFFLFQALDYDMSIVRWAPVIVLCFFTTLYSIGLGPVAFVVASEVLSSEVAAFANSLAMTATWIVFFTVIKGFPLVSSLIGSYGCFFIFALCCTSTFLITYFLVPETKGRSIESILRELNGPQKKSEGNSTGNRNSMEIY